MNRNQVVYLILAILILTIFLSAKIFNLNLLNIVAYILLLVGIYIFYSSYLKQNKIGIIISSMLFLIGAVVFVITKYEMLNLGRIFIPASLTIIGISLGFGTVIVKPNKLSLLFSVLFVVSGIWLILNRSEATTILFLSASFSILKNYWLVIIGSILLIFLASKNFKRKDH